MAMAMAEPFHAASTALGLADVMYALPQDALATLWGCMDRTTKKAFKETCKLFRDLAYGLTKTVKLGSRTAHSLPEQTFIHGAEGISFDREPRWRQREAAAACLLLHKHRRLEKLVFMFGRTIRAAALLRGSRGVPACLAHVTTLCLRGVKLRPKDAEALFPHLPSLKDLELHLCPYYFIEGQQHHLAGLWTAHCPKLRRLQCMLSEYWDWHSMTEKHPRDYDESFGEKALLPLVPLPPSLEELVVSSWDAE